MSSSAFAGSQVTAPRSSIRLSPYLNEAWFDLLKMVRLPVYSVASIAFPVMFYVLFGVVFGRQGSGSADVPRYLLASYGAFGVIGASLFGFGVGIAMERGQGWLQVKRASPMPPAAYFVAKLFTCLAFSTVIVLALILVGVTAGGVHLSLLAGSSTFSGTGAGLRALLCSGTGHCLLRGTKFSACDCEPALSASFILFRSLGSSEHAAAFSAADCAGPAALSSGAVGPAGARLWTGDHSESRAGAAEFGCNWAWPGMAWFPAR